ncbi:MAG TPA: hypothetical protein VGE44_08235, partial [Daejeonella sp.]
MLRYLRPSLLLLLLCFCLDVFAQSTLPYNESFRNATAPGMVFGGSDAPGDKSHKAFLTALTDSAGFNSNTTDRDGNPIAANPNDAIGGGYLRLTKNARYQAGYARNTTSFPSANGLSLSFEYYTHGGGGGDGASQHADGISVFLYDASATSFTFGGYGGSLGYAQRSGGGGPVLPGVSKGYLGIGIDEFGNFATIADGKSGGNDVDGTPGPDTWNEPNSDNVTIRGDGDGDSNGATNYDWKTTVLVNKPPFNFGIRGNVDGRSTINPSTRPAGGLLSTESGYRRVKIDLEHINNGSINGFRINVYITIGTGTAAEEKHVLVNYDYYGDAERPVNLSYGFGASTGFRTNIHEIRGLAIVVPASTPLAPNTALNVAKSGNENSNITFAQSDFYNVDYTLSKFTDPNGDALNKIKIKTVPNALHGVLKLSPSGTVVMPDDEITYANIPNLYFEPVNEYDGAASFTWNGADPGGLYAAGDATVNITLNPIPSITPSNLAVCRGATTGLLVYSNMADGANQYAIDFGAAAEAQGFVDVAYTALPASPISITVPATAAVADYTADITVRNTVAGTTSTPVAFTVTVNPLPGVGMAVSDATICSGATATITLSNSVVGINYQLRLDAGNTNVGAAVAGTGGDITFSVSPTSTTTYNVLATNATTSCSAMVTDKPIVTVNP